MFAALLICAFAVAASGCASGNAPADTAEPSAESAPAADVSDAELVAVLARADEVDGTEDQVVSMCAGCGLAMQGEADYAASFHGYEMHFCSEHCREQFEKDPTAMVMALSFPEEEEEEN